MLDYFKGVSHQSVDWRKRDTEAERQRQRGREGQLPLLPKDQGRIVQSRPLKHSGGMLVKLLFFWDVAILKQLCPAFHSPLKNETLMVRACFHVLLAMCW